MKLCDEVLDMLEAPKIVMQINKRDIKKALKALQSDSDLKFEVEGDTIFFKDEDHFFRGEDILNGAKIKFKGSSKKR